MPDYLENRLLEKQVIADEEIVLTDDNLNFLGPEVTVKRCRLVIRCTSRYLHIENAQLLDCVIEAKKKLANLAEWCEAVIRGCTFTGHFHGNDFGHWPDRTAPRPSGSIEDCDFSAAILDGCRFMRTDMSTIKLPRWPCFTILDPRKNGQEIIALPWPKTMQVWAQCAADDLEESSALVYHAPSLVNRYGCNEDEIRNALERFSGVIM
jgi:hypothetical protein